ncbi:MAG: carbon-nitrogen hydrolase family protein [Caulobacterales bacterium]
MTHLAVAALQLELNPGDNLDRIEDEVAVVKRRFPWIQLVLLPELAAFGADPSKAQPLPGPAEDRFRRMARDRGFWLVPGSVYERAGDQVFNTTPVIDPGGEVVLRYRKIYPFTPYEAGIAAGSEPMVFEIPKIGKIGVSICYDMWFPETTRTLAWLGAEVILHPSMTNTIDREVEQAMARATAAMNQVWFVDVNIAGDLGYGGSITCGPGGEVVHRSGPAREIIALDLDLDQVKRVRERGWHGLGQVLKSFRDGPETYAPYAPGRALSPAFAALGPLEKPRNESA